MRTLLLLGLALAAGCAGGHEETRNDDPAAAQRAGLDQSAIDVGLERTRQVAGACVGQSHGGINFTVRLTIRSDGRTIEAHVVDGDVADMSVAACIEGALTAAVFPPFSGPPVTITVPYYVH
jgi:hypothetical protein